jgi:hypothetical protein
MNPALVVIGAYIIVTMVLQLLSFSRGVDQIVPSLSLSFFLACSCVHSDWVGRLPFT